MSKKIHTYDDVFEMRISYDLIEEIRREFKARFPNAKIPFGKFMGTQVMELVFYTQKEYDIYLDIKERAYQHRHIILNYVSKKFNVIFSKNMVPEEYGYKPVEPVEETYRIRLYIHRKDTVSINEGMYIKPRKTFEKVTN